MALFGDAMAVSSDLIYAAETAVADALAPLDGERPDLLCFFVAGDEVEDVEAAGARVMELADAAITLGCSAEGVLGQGRGVELTSAVSVWAAVLPGVRARPFHLEPPFVPVRAEPGASALAGGGIPERSDDDVVALLLADPATFAVRDFVERSGDRLPDLPLAGGLASSVHRPDGNRLFTQGKVIHGGAAGVLLGGDLWVRTLVSQGCRPVGPPMTVTDASGKIIYELAGRPALTKLEEVVSDLGPYERSLVRPALLLGIAMDEYAETHEYGDLLVRSVVGADGEQGAVALAEPVEVGCTVRLQVHDACTASHELDGLLARARKDSCVAAESALLISCNGRGSTLFSDASHDVLAVRRGLDITKVAGCFAAGEIGWVGGRNHLHGQTACVVMFGQPPEPGQDVRH